MAFSTAAFEVVTTADVAATGDVVTTAAVTSAPSATGTPKGGVSLAVLPVIAASKRRK